MDKLISLESAIKALTGWETDPTDEEIEYTLRKLATDKNVGTKISREPLELARAISGLTEWQKHVQADSNINRDITVAIEALKAQLGTNLAEVGTDCISRQAAIDALDKRFDKIPMEQTTEILKLRKDLRGLPSIQSEQKRGRWIYGEDEYGIDGYHCDKCGFFVPWDYTHKFINYIEDYNFCPSCGADMRGEQDE